ERFNRVEGHALGRGLSQRLGAGVSLVAGGRYGFSHDDWKGRAGISYRQASGAGLSVTAYDDHELVGEDSERSMLVNSVAAQEFGSDHTNSFGSRGLEVAAFTPPVGAWRASVSLALEKHRPLSVNASPASGEFDSTLAAARIEEQRLELVFERPTRLTFGGFEARYRIAGSGFRYAALQFPGDWQTGVKIALRANVERPYGTSRLVTQFTFAAASDRQGDMVYPADATPRPPRSLRPQQLVFFGGAVTGPGYDFHRFIGTSGGSARIEWQMQALFPAISLGRFGRTPARMTLAPYVNVVGINGGAGSLRSGHGLYPSVGVGALTIFDILRLDVARGLHDGRWTMSIDLNRDFWPVL
ncbi:MAG: hypothetical protein ACSLFE_11690, partial [Gemmatimonadaceae bacterium]